MYISWAKQTTHKRKKKKENKDALLITLRWIGAAVAIGVLFCSAQVPDVGIKATVNRQMVRGLVAEVACRGYESSECAHVSIHEVACCQIEGTLLGYVDPVFQRACASHQYSRVNEKRSG